MIRTALGFILACATVGPIAYMAADREPPFYRLRESFIVPNEIKPGDTFEVNWLLHRNAYRKCTPIGKVSRWIVDRSGATKEYEDVDSVADPMNEASILQRELVLPMGLVPGEARYHAKACFACNPVQRLSPVCITEPSITFTVLPH